MSLLADLLLVVVALAGASFLTMGMGYPPSLGAAMLSAMGTWLFTALVLRHYDAWASDSSTFDDLALTSILVLATITVLALQSLVFRWHGIPNIGILLLLFWPTALVLRVTLFRTLTPHTGPIDEVLVVGVGPMGRATAEQLRRRGRVTVLGFARFTGEETPSALKGKVLGDAAHLEDVLRTVPVGEVYLASNSFSHADEVQGAIQVLERFGVPFALPPYLFRLERARPLAVHGLVDGYIHYQSVTAKRTQMALKRSFDILASGVALWVLAPLLLLVALVVKVTSRGPLLFRQTRVGLHGRPFRMLKFRTMVDNAEALKAQLAAQNEMDGPVFKIKHDPRITPVGRFLRKFSIDELPQLVNVLRGDMSVVGPRPPVPSEVVRYEPWQRRRLSVRPGLTCIWQVSGRNAISFEQWMYMDLQYIDTWSFLKDVSLILRTFPVVLTGRGAS